jgi:hypothetical protein
MRKADKSGAQGPGRRGILAGTNIEQRWHWGQLAACGACRVILTAGWDKQKLAMERLLHLRALGTAWDASWSAAGTVQAVHVFDAI